MGFFSRKPTLNEHEDRNPAPKPYVLDDATLRRLPQLLDDFADAEGSDPAIRAGARAIAAAAGFTDGFQAVLDISILQRPWQMLAACALRAAQDRDALLAGKILVFTWIWKREVVPKCGLGDFLDMNLSDAVEFQVDIAASAFEALETMSPTEVIWKTRTAPFSAESARIFASIMMLEGDVRSAPLNDLARVAAATVLVDAAQRGAELDRDVVSSAQRIVNESALRGGA
jgi:hypothetical protein